MTQTSTSAPAPPIARRVPLTRTFHGDTFVDSYEWLRDKESPETVAYLEAENAYTEAMTRHLTGLREAIFDEIKERTQETDLSVPTRTGDYWYYARTQEGKQYAVMCRVPATDPDDWAPPALQPGTAPPGEEVLLDCNELAEGHDFFSLGAFSVSLDQLALAYSTDVVGNERYTIRLLKLDSGEHLPDEITNTAHGATWSADGAQLFYCTVDEAWRPEKVWRHRVGSRDTTGDVCVFHETDEKFWVSVDRTMSDRFILIGSGSRVTSEVRVIDADDATADPVVLFPRRDGVEYSVEHAVVAGRDNWLVLHNDGAPNFTLAVGGLDVSAFDELQTVVPHDPSVRLSDIQASGDTVVLNVRENGLAQVRVFTPDDSGIGDGTNIPFDEPMFTAFATGFADWHQPFVRVSYQSWLTPQTVLDYYPVTRTRVVRKVQPVVGYDPGLFVQSREWVRSRDGVDIPLSLVHHRDVAPRAGSPLLVYGYGSYEISSDPRLRTSVLSLLERGMVFAVAHVRGGGELGRGWYEHGKLLEKKNTFNDFVDCARHLVDTGWTSADRMVAHGGSAGGLLVGAVANQAPELFAGVVAQVPFVDALTTILNPELPLTVIEWDEWGDPLHDAQVYAYMKSYTPYENIETTHYPAIYALTSINDTRVYYVEPAKWVAQLRATVAPGRQILFKCEMSAGHGGASGRYDAWREIADYSAWIIDVAGVAHASQHPIGSAAGAGQDT
jgi:oligopeptidase B